MRARVASVSVLALVACGSPRPPAPAPQPASATSGAFEKTYAGQNTCNPKSHERPFVIDWDATDQSLFQARAASDVVLVKYEGCSLQILDGCRDDAVKGAFGSYRVVEWTTGGLETIDVKTEGELYAKLPLGVATLGARLQSGEQFHMEYYVAGTRTATRDAVYRKDLDAMKACAGATHFVYGYNLGAFALGSLASVKAGVDGSVYGFGGGGATSSQTKAEKKGGQLAACRADGAKEIDGCKAPIRLILRPITEGENPDAAAAKAPESDAAANLAGKLKAESDAEKQALEHFESARAKMNAKDGKGCLAELDAHDQLDPRPNGLSTNAASGPPALFRAQCLMLAGQCDAGRTLFRKAYGAQYAATTTPEQVDTITQQTVATWCQGGKMTPAEEYDQATNELSQGAYYTKKTPAQCKAAFDKVLALYEKAGKPWNVGLTGAAAQCMGRAGDCEGAKALYQRGLDEDPETKAKGIKVNPGMLGAVVPECKK